MSEDAEDPGLAEVSDRSSPESDFPDVSQIISSSHNLSSSPQNEDVQPSDEQGSGVEDELIGDIPETPGRASKPQERSSSPGGSSKTRSTHAAESAASASSPNKKVAESISKSEEKSPPLRSSASPRPSHSIDSIGKIAAAETSASARVSKWHTHTEDIDDLHTDESAEPLPASKRKLKYKKRKRDDDVSTPSTSSRKAQRAVVCPPPLPNRSSLSHRLPTSVQLPSPMPASPDPEFWPETKEKSKKSNIPPASQPAPSTGKKPQSVSSLGPRASVPSASQPPPRPVKRARVEAVAPPSSPIVVHSSSPSKPSDSPRRRSLSRTTRHQTFWHLDGSVVILIERTLFKLHRSRLAQQSEYFAELFHSATRNGKRKILTVYSDDEVDGTKVGEAMDTNGDGLLEGESVDSCPVYRITKVSVTDFEAVLKALESGVILALRPPSFPELASMLRASYALAFPTINAYASHFLREMWPGELSCLSPDRTETHTHHAAEMLTLARRCGLPELCKRAFYELLRSDCLGLATSLHDDDSDSKSDDNPDGHIARADILRLVSAREHLQRAWLRIARAPPAPSAVPCPLEQIPPAALDAAREPVLQKCRDARASSITQWTTEVTQAALFEEGMYDPLCALERLCEKDWQGMGYCVGCVGARTDVWGEERVRLWKDLDQWLGTGVVEDGSRVL